MEDKPKSFYEILSANTKKKEKSETPDTKINHKVLAWIVIFLANSSILMLCWNYAVSEIFKFPSITFSHSILLYSFAKTLTRGMFTIQ